MDASTDLSRHPSSSEKDAQSRHVRNDDKFIFAFNRFFADYIILLKRSSPHAKTELKRHYRAIEDMSTSTEHLDWFRDSVDVDAVCNSYDARCAQDSSSSSSSAATGGLHSMVLAKGVDVDMLLRPSSTDSDSSAKDAKDAGDATERGAFLQVLSYLCLLACLHYLYREHERVETTGQSDSELESLLQKTLLILPKVQKGEDTSDSLSEIMDDDLLKYLERMVNYELQLYNIMLEDEQRETETETKTEAGASDDKEKEKEKEKASGSGKSDEPFGDFAAMYERFKNSKIGKLASDITDDIDLSQLNTENPMEMLNFANLTKEDTALGSIVKKMSNKVTSGDVNYQELLGEAMSMFQGMDLGSVLSNLTPQTKPSNQQNPGGCGGQKASARQASSSSSSSSPAMSTHERLRRKLEARKTQQN